MDAEDEVEEMEIAEEEGVRLMNRIIPKGRMKMKNNRTNWFLTYWYKIMSYAKPQTFVNRLSISMVYKLAVCAGKQVKVKS